MKQGNTIKRLYRSEKDRKLTGLCAGLAEYFNIDVTIVRILVLGIIILSGILPGTALYFITSLITPTEGASHA